MRENGHRPQGGPSGSEGRESETNRTFLPLSCLGASFGSRKVGPTAGLAWFLFPERFQCGCLSLRDPAPSEPGYPFRS